MSSQPDDLFTRLQAAEAEPAALIPILEEIAELSAQPESFEFMHCITIIGQSPLLASTALEVWLGGERIHNNAAGTLLHELSVAHLAGEQLVSFVPGQQGASRAVMTGYRLAAFDAAPAVVVGWIVACLLAGYDPTAERLVALLGYQAKQYPRTVSRLLATLDAELVERYPALGEMRQASETGDAERDAAPRLKELSLSISEREILHRFKLRERRDIQREAEEASIFRHIVTQSHFKYAREVALQFDAGGVAVEQPLVMQEHILVLELPLLSVTDPLRTQFRRNTLLQGRAP